MIIYRKATINDLEELVRLRIEFMKEAIYVKNDDNQLENNLREYFSKSLTDNSFISWLAIDEDKIVGTSGLCFYNLPPSYKNITGEVAYIMNMYTLRNYRSRGIAYNLFEKIILEAKDKGYKKICLNATQMGKPLYVKFGFKEIDGEMELNI